MPTEPPPRPAPPPEPPRNPVPHRPTPDPETLLFGDPFDAAHASER
jgi:hypothetical protein